MTSSASSGDSILFQQVHGFSVEEELGAEFISLVEDRWCHYDVVVSTMPLAANSLPTMEINGVLATRLHRAMPPTMKLATSALECEE